MTAEERLELAIRTMTRIRDHRGDCYEQSMKQGLFNRAAHDMDEYLMWDKALMMISRDDFLLIMADLYLKEESEK